MPRVAAVIVGTIGVFLLTKGNIGGIPWVVAAALIQWPQIAAITWPGASQSNAPRRGVARGLYWAVAIILLCVLIGAVGFVVAFLLGMTSFLGLLIAATVMVLAARVLYWIEPRGAADANRAPE
jgi:hypothetical protein